MSQHASAPASNPTATPASGRWPSISHDSTAATAGMTANSMATAAAPWVLIARRYRLTASVAFNSTMPVNDAALDDLGATEHTLLTIGATEHGADVMLAGLSSALRERLPDRRVRFRLDRNVSLADSIERGLVDLAIMLDGAALDRANASGLVRLQWVSARTFAVSARDPLPLVIFSEPCTLREPAFSILERHHVAYDVAAECGDLAGLYAAVRSGLGVALLPMIGKLPDGLCLAEGLPPGNFASILVRGRAGIDPDVLRTVDAAVRDVLAAEN
ncbi:MAG: hypothetical protein QOC58_1858 [Mycobacterium sp.]|nr:hypothetical protein [Mycobacterium sp.]